MFKISECKKIMKKCSKCGIIKTINHYSKDNKKKDKLFNKCKECCKQERKTYTHICNICGKEFNSFRKDTKCCSNKCMGKWRRINLIGENNPLYGKERLDIRGENNINYNRIKCKCDYCNKEIMKIKSEYDRNKLHFCSIECRSKYNSKIFKGENNPNYNSNITDEEREKGRFGIGIPQWRNKVYEHDNYTCQCCGDNKGGKLNAHHLNSYDWDKEHRTDLNNGVTLCNKCHKEFHKKYGYGNNTKEQFEEFINNITKTA